MTLARRVVLVNLPFASPATPSIGLGLLATSLQRAGHKVAVLDLQLDFERLIGARAYRAIEETASIGPFAGEWLFSLDLFPGRNPARYLQDILMGGLSDQPGRVDGEVVSHVQNTVALIAPFLSDAAALVRRLHPEVVGLTSLFQQHCACLALAKRLRLAEPTLPILLGGPNCDDETGRETQRSFPFLSAVVMGEAETIIVELVERLCERRTIDDLPGVVTPSSRTARELRVATLDDSPPPNYDDYFASLAAVGRSTHDVLLPFETSRGCWWGAKSHCVFCGINPTAMASRYKSPARALAEIRDLARRYPSSRMLAVDNILPHAYLKTVLPELAKHPIDRSLFYEVKSNLRDTDVRVLRAAGVTAVQPGIESLDSEILTLMRKGVSGPQNVLMLRSCELHGVAVYWNLLYGFPEEPAAAYRRLVEQMPSLYHLAPPGAANRIVLNRFSPHFNAPDRFHLENIRPYPAYRYIYPFDPERVRRLAYYFCYDVAKTARTPLDEGRLRAGVAAWRDRFERAFLFWAEDDDGVVVLDGRGEPARTIRLDETSAALLRGGDTLWTSRSREALSAPAADIASALARLAQEGLIFREADTLVSLALPLADYAVNSGDEQATQRRTKLHRAQGLLRAASVLPGVDGDDSGPP
ncbi:RiPP maturation radical SAM C-methyltransferase [Halomonas sp. V046]|uniref:RiPP maturation radical SAM C-methyltransferase n=1 Tax=Halomonas sp. V046 TaxID=3459611 RepID=UPI00404427C1